MMFFCFVKFCKRVGVLLFAFFAIACGHTDKPAANCQELDWYEIGRRDGSKGLDFAGHKEVKTVCAQSDHSTQEALYNNGFDSGIAQFCSPENAFEIGRSGQKLNNICPPMLKAAFAKRYEEGRRVEELTKMNHEIDRKLRYIDLNLSDRTVELARQELLKNEKLVLVAKKKSLESELQALR